jgi:hypothetical protein
MISPSTRATSPLGAWSSRILDGVISTALMNNLIKKKKMTISLKNVSKKKYTHIIVTY